MNYSAIHDRLIERARNRQLACYTESHHILPECMGGTNAAENMVELTPEEHYVIHQLLVKMHPDNEKLVFAASMMGYTRTTNKIYGWLKRKHSECMKRKPAHNKGKRLSKATIEKMKLAHRGKTLSKQHKENIRVSHLGTKHSAETIEKMRKAKLGKVISLEVRAKISAALRKPKKKR